MSFFDEVKKEVGITDMQMLSGFSYVNFCGETLYIEGIVRLEKILNECVIIRTKTAVIEVCGELRVDDITQRSIVISGRIDNVSTRRLK
ncbi:MAG: hypothetical protein J1F36_01445 [Clostridiales bacterium]|nr:hypothetical protein [Clostridiales bacterium]